METYINIWKKVLYFCIFVLILLIAFFGYRKFNLDSIRSTFSSNSTYDNQAQSENEDTITSETIDQLDIINFSAAQAEDIVPTQYSIDLNTGEFLKIEKEGKNTGYFYNFNPTNNSAAHVNVSKDKLQELFDSESEIGTAFQVYFSKISGDFNFPTIEESKPITTNNLINKIGPKVSPDGNKVIYYTSESAKAKNENDINAYSVHLVDLVLGKEIKILGQGTFLPNWIDKNEFLYLNAEGLNKFNLITQKSENLLDFAGQANVKYDASVSGKILAITFPDSRKVFIYKIVPGGLENISEIESIAYWVNISPNEDEIVLQTTENEKITSKPKLIFYNLEGDKTREDILLKSFSNESLFINQWK